jgi:four helix bundle protein
MLLALDVYRASRAFPRDELYGLTSQLRRAAVAVPSKIAEGQAALFTPRVLAFPEQRPRLLG